MRYKQVAAMNGRHTRYWLRVFACDSLVKTIAQVKSWDCCSDAMIL
jgi:hypothetical protein